MKTLNKRFTEELTVIFEGYIRRAMENDEMEQWKKQFDKLMELRNVLFDLDLTLDYSKLDNEIRSIAIEAHKRYDAKNNA